MNIYEFADENKLSLYTKYFNSPSKNNFTTSFSKTWVVDNGVPIICFGEGRTSLESINSYSKRISGQKLLVRKILMFGEADYVEKVIAVPELEPIKE